MAVPASTPGPFVFGFDTETYYSSEYSLKKMPVDTYVADPRFDCYLVSFWGPTDHWVGHPKDCPWDRFSGTTWVSHNSRFDRAVLFRLQELGIVPPHIRPVEWHDTAALAVFLQAPRSLAGASRELLGETPDKSIREKMKGLNWLEARHWLKDQEILDYALEDARLACRLWIDHADKWPANERTLSALTVKQGEHGIKLDTDRVHQGIRTLTKHCHTHASKLPWAATEPPTSTKALANACRARNIPPPPSTAEDDPSCAEWEERYGSQIPWVREIRGWRRANRMLRLLETMRDRCRPDGTLPFSLKYFGATATGRWSGDAGLNLQNFNREPLHQVDPRRCLIARPGHKLIIADLCQIEPRVLAWFAGDHKLLQRIEDGLPLYQAHAETSMGYTGSNLKKEDPNLYLLAKCRVIGLGYGAGSKTFRNLAGSYGLNIDASKAKATVDDYRRDNPGVVALWRQLEEHMREAEGDTCFLRLPNGRHLRYFQVEADGRNKLTAAIERGGRRFHWYGGKLTENLVQATARDIFAKGLLRIHQAGIRILWTVHDEVICEGPEDSPVTPQTVSELLAQTPAWMPGLPVEAEATTSLCYQK